MDYWYGSSSGYQTKVGNKVNYGTHVIAVKVTEAQYCSVDANVNGLARICLAEALQGGDQGLVGVAAKAAGLGQAADFEDGRADKAALA